MLRLVRERWFLCALLAGVTLTLLFPEPVHAATRDLPPHVVIALALFLMSWTMPSRSLAGELRRPGAALWAIAISYSVAPALAWGVGAATPWRDVQIGMLLSACVPCTLASCVIWTRLADGNEATALLAILGSTLLSWLLTTAWLSWTTGTQVELDTPRMMFDLVATLVLPVAAGQGLRAIPRLTAWVDQRRAALGHLAQLLVLAIILRATAAVGLQVHSGAATLSALTLVAAALLTQVVHVSTLAVGWWTSAGWLDRPRRVAIAFASSQKTLPVALLLFERYYRDAFPLAVGPLLFYHVGQLIVDTFIAERLKAGAELTTEAQRHREMHRVEGE